MEQALALAERGVEFATEERYYYLLDTQVRILLKLHREQEADAIIQRVLRAVPDFAQFQEFKANLLS